MKKLYLILLLLSTFLFQACDKSALSDVEILDPYLVEVSVQIAQNQWNEKEVQVFIRDQNNHPVELLNGWVEVNGSYARWDRAEINSLSERGYIYKPEKYEHDFRIFIQLNSEDLYWFDLNPETGFPGFIRNYPMNTYEYESRTQPFYRETYYLLDMPFRNHEVKVSYQILKK